MLSKGVQFGLQYLPEGEYTINGGLGNRVLQELKVEDGILYRRNNENDEWKRSDPIPFNEFKMPKELQNTKNKSWLSRFF